jgi:hypothetical protein
MSTTCTEPVYDPSCSGGGGGGGGGDDEQIGGGGGGSPILISFKGEQDDDDFALCGPDDPVTFDIAADGNPRAISWTRRGAKVGFLALDRNGNGLIDSGAELFGNHTSLADGTPPNEHSNGYLALGSYDLRENEGNQDGRIIAEDGIWSSLRVWIDKNHDGVSQPEELFTLDMVKIVEIGLGYGTYGKLDKYGNLFRFKSYAITSDENRRRHAIPTWDVFFVKATR